VSTLTISGLAAPPVARPAPLSGDLLADIATGLAASEARWRPHAHHPPTDRRPVRLVVCDLWEAWVVGWTPGQHVDVHDHGDSAGVLVVVEGDLAEVLPTGPHRLLRTWSTGSVVDLPIGVVHDVVGLGPGPSTSVHVYSPPLGAMTYYDDEGRPVRVEDTTDEPAITDLRTVSRALHPSVRRG
jgi:hypothetical protein